MGFPFTEMTNAGFAAINSWVASVFFFNVLFFIPGVDLPLVVVWLIVGAIYMTIKMRFINFRGFWHAIELTMGWFDTKFYAEVSEPIITEKIIRRFMTRETGGGAPDMARVRYGLSRLRDHLDYIGSLADHRSWLAGEDLSIADLAAAAHLSVIDYLGDIPWTDFPVAKSWYQRIKSRPSFRPLLGDAVRGMSPLADYANLDF